METVGRRLEIFVSITADGYDDRNVTSAKSNVKLPLSVLDSHYRFGLREKPSLALLVEPTDMRYAVIMIHAARLTDAQNLVRHFDILLRGG